MPGTRVPSGRAPSDRTGDPSMSSDPSPHLPPPVAPPGAEEADPQPQPAAPTSDLPEVYNLPNIYTLPPCGESEHKVYRIPQKLYQFLKNHQKEGLNWLWKIHCSGSSGGMIADDMGLGKTLQMTTFLSGLYHSNIIERVMIVAPLSILNAWTKELKRSGLERRVQDYYDSGDRGLRIIQEEGGILLLPYTMYESNHELLIRLPKLKWDYVILDEAHKIKNLGANITKSMKKLKCNKKILLTGTPIMRDLMDIFSLLEFMNPEILGSKKQFRKNYVKPVHLGQYSNSTKHEKDGCLEALARLWRKTSPHILRRTKNVLIESGELPCKKHDILIWLGLTPLQKLLYRNLSKLCAPEFDNEALTGIMLCQRICNDPELVLQVRDGGGTVIKELAKKLLSSVQVDEVDYRMTQNSCKLSFILDLVENLFEEEKINKDLFAQNQKEGLVQWKNLKILIFSQHIEMLTRIGDIIQHAVPEGNIIQMDGSTKKEERDMITETFNSSEGPSILLLSAKVGGEGLNLTAATRVIIVDPSWNLSDDNQISDRVYRIGQQEDVVIYRLFTCNTIEEHAYKKQLLKGNLAQAVIDGRFCTPTVIKEDGKVMNIGKGGFNSSRTLELIKRLSGDKLELDMKHQTFLQKHKHVVGVTDQTSVFSEVVALMKDVPCDDSDEDDANLPFTDASMHMQLRNRRSLEDSDASVHEYATRRMEIPSNKAGVLRGRHWDAIKKIGLQTGSKIEVIDRDKPDHGSPFKSVHISGNLKGFVKAKTLILEAIEQVEDVVSYVPVPVEHVGFILGRQFKNLKSMQQESGVASIEYVRNENMLRIIGVEAAVEKAKALVLEKALQARNRQGVPPHHGLQPAAQQRPGCIVHQPPHPGPPGHGVQAPPHQGPPAQSHGGNGEPAFGTDGSKVETQGNVLHAAIKNMQYAVTVDVLHTVFSSFGTVQKIAILEKNGGTQALIQYPDVNTAAVAKEALEGHCIYDGGYCKLHLSYSRHTDLNVKGHGGKSRDYTVPAGVIQGVPQPPGVQATSSGWQGNLQAAGAYARPGAPQSHSVNGQMQNWNPGSSMYPPARTYPGQMYSSQTGGFPSTPSTAPPQYARVPQPPGVQATSSGWQGNLQAAGAYARPGAPQSHSVNGQMQNWNPGNSMYPPARTYPGQMYSSQTGGFPSTPSTAPPQYAMSGGFPNTRSTALPLPHYAASGGFPNTPTGAPPGARPQQLHPSQHMPPPHHGNQSRGTPGISQPPPPSSHYR